MIDIPDLLYHIRATRFDAIIVVATAFAAVFVSIEHCILIGVLLSFLCYVPRAARVEASELVVTPQRLIRDRIPTDPRCSLLRIYNFEGELFFGSSPDFEEILDRIEEDMRIKADACHLAGDQRPVQVLLLRLKHVRNLDAVCLHKLGEFLERVKASGVRVGLTGIRDDVFAALDAVGIVDSLGSEQIFRENQQLWSATMAAVEWAYTQLGENRCSHCRRDSSDDGGLYFMI